MAGMDGRAPQAAVAVIGAGIMGSAMAGNLVAAGQVTRVWDRSASATGRWPRRVRRSRRRRRMQSGARGW